MGDQDSRSPHGERGLKYRRPMVRHPPVRRSPHGERGLKSQTRIDDFRKYVALLMESVD